jgi:hypothetical protein
MSLGELISIEELRRRMESLSEGQVAQTERDMGLATENVVGLSKEYCTPGRSPYWRAPYSDDNDPRREPPHMRDTITAEVIVEGRSVHGIVGTPKSYSPMVHEGTKHVEARPFIIDPIYVKQDETRAILGEGVKAHIKRVCRE